jgi:hypothetical protein
MTAVSQNMSGSRAGFGGAKTVVGHAQQGMMDTKMLEYFMATGFGSRGGPNKVSNKLKRCPSSYLYL